MNSVVFRAFKAVDEPDSCQRFIEGHRKVLEIFGITMITSNKALWVNHKNTYVILVAAKDDGRPLGGARIQIADDDLLLPIEDAVGLVDKNIFEVVNQYKEFPTAEICGLWNSREIAGYGIGSFFLTRAAIALAKAQLSIKTLFALGAPATVNMASKAGFEVERALGKDGFFNYPKLDLVATAMIIKDLNNIKNATAENMEFVADFVLNPVQNRIEKGPKGEIMVEYQLSLQNEKK
ncbi:MAG: GNAT family N-acetyltransferase [Sphingobacteriaceae bacterium]